MRHGTRAAVIIAESVELLDEAGIFAFVHFTPSE